MSSPPCPRCQRPSACGLVPTCAAGPPAARAPPASSRCGARPAAGCVRGRPPSPPLAGPTAPGRGQGLDTRDSFLDTAPTGDRHLFLSVPRRPCGGDFHRPGGGQRQAQEQLPPGGAGFRPREAGARHPEPVLLLVPGHCVSTGRGRGRWGGLQGRGGGRARRGLQPRAPRGADAPRRSGLESTVPGVSQMSARPPGHRAGPDPGVSVLETLGGWRGALAPRGRHGRGRRLRPGPACRALTGCRTDPPAEARRPSTAAPATSASPASTTTASG